MEINCPKCGKNEIRKNGHRRGKQNYQCKSCGRQFIEYYSEMGYPSQVKEIAIAMYLNGNGFRAIERIIGVNHNTVIRWVRQAGKKLSRKMRSYKIPLVGQIDELQTFIGKKTNKIWIWTALDKYYSEILEYVIGDRSSKTFEKLWEIIKYWSCYFWVTDGYKVYPRFIPEGDQIVSKIYMTRIEGENSRLRHYLARLRRKTFCYSKSKEMLFISIKLLIHYLKYRDVSLVV